MKHIIVSCILSYLLVVNLVGKNADCSEGSLHAYPQSKFIKQNTTFMLEGSGSLCHCLVDSFGTKYRVYLEAEGHTVELAVREEICGMFNRFQVFMTTNKKLFPGKEYYLKIDGMKEPSYQSMLCKPITWNKVTKEHEPVSWVVKAGTDKVPPIWLEAPVLESQHFIMLGCGPDVTTLFKVAVEDESEVWVKTELVDLATGESHYYYLVMTDSLRLGVGHSMCSGAFRYNGSHKCKVRFMLFDSCMQTDKKWTNWIHYKSPQAN